MTIHQMITERLSTTLGTVFEYLSKFTNNLMHFEYKVLNQVNNSNDEVKTWYSFLFDWNDIGTEFDHWTFVAFICIFTLFVFMIIYTHMIEEIQPLNDIRMTVTNKSKTFLDIMKATWLIRLITIFQMRIEDQIQKQHIQDIIKNSNITEMDEGSYLMYHNANKEQENDDKNKKNLIENDDDDDNEDNLLAKCLSQEDDSPKIYESTEDNSEYEYCEEQDDYIVTDDESKIIIIENEGSTTTTTSATPTPSSSPISNHSTRHSQIPLKLRHKSSATANRRQHTNEAAIPTQKLNINNNSKYSHDNDELSLSPDDRKTKNYNFGKKLYDKSSTVITATTVTNASGIFLQRKKRLNSSGSIDEMLKKPNKTMKETTSILAINSRIISGKNQKKSPNNNLATNLNNRSEHLYKIKSNNDSKDFIAVHKYQFH